MENWRTCPRGHRWDAGEGPPAPARCPLCGEDAANPPETLQPTIEASPEELLRPAAGDGRPAAPETFPRIPGYQVLDLLGEGGMGVVYKARQTAIERTVAIKMLRGHRDGAGGRERFLREAAAVARLQHPGIVQIFEVGEADSAPYFSLEFCPGGSLEDRLAGNPLEAREAARIVKTIALAVQAAHEQGIVHRDLKPANILLSPARRGSNPDVTPGAGGGLTASGGWRSGTDDPSAEPSPLAGWVPKVADFGIARQVDADQAQTRTGAILGSPSYMAPEQAWGESKRVGPRADVWALGAILYECLTGRPPFKGPSALATLQQIRSHDPVPPQRLLRTVPRDLDTICLKCLEKDPARRYPSAEALAEDLARFLEGEPIRARPPRWWERLHKWARRRPGVAGLLGLLLLAVCAGVATACVYHFRLEAQNDRAEENFRLALGAVEEMLTEVGDKDLAAEPHMDSTRRALLQKALDFYQRMTAANADNPLLRERIASAHRRVGDIERLLGRYDEALAAYAEAIDRLHALGPTAEARPGLVREIADCHNGSGEVYRALSRPAQAEAEYRQALALQEELSERHPDDPRYRRDQARSHSNLGILARTRDRPRQAREEFTTAVTLLEGVVAEHRDDPDHRHRLAQALVNQGTALRLTEGFREAETAYLRARDLLEGLLKEDPKRREYTHDLAICLTNLGNLYFRERQLAQAEVPLRRARQLLGELVRGFPEVPLYRKELANTSNSVGAVLISQEKWEPAHAFMADAERQWEHLARAYPEVSSYRGHLGVALGNRGRAYRRQGDLGQARAYLEQGLTELLAALRDDPRHTDFTAGLRGHSLALAETLVRQGDHEAARKWARTLTEELPAAQAGRYRALCFLARCVQTLRTLPASPALAEQERAYTDLARTLIEEAGRPAPRELRPLRTDPDFKPLADEAPFPTLLGSVPPSLGKRPWLCSPLAA